MIKIGNVLVKFTISNKFKHVDTDNLCWQNKTLQSSFNFDVVRFNNDRLFLNLS